MTYSISGDDRLVSRDVVANAAIVINTMSCYAIAVHAAVRTAADHKGVRRSAGVLRSLVVVVVEGLLVNSLFSALCVSYEASQRGVLRKTWEMSALLAWCLAARMGKRQHSRGQVGYTVSHPSRGRGSSSRETRRACLHIDDG